MSVVRLRAGTGGVEFSSSSNRLGDVVKEIVKKYHVADLIFTRVGKVRPWARILVNGRSQEFVGGLDARLSDGDRIALIFSFPYHENV
jgi:molybdopterin converting factor small subunit